MFLSCYEWTPTNIILRIFISFLLGCIIGLDRGVKKRGAGAKTNTIVCLGSTLVMLTAQYMSVYFPGQADIARMASQVISGVGFLGVGTIIVTGHQVRGLTTAASLWACACIGLAIGIGFIDGGIIIAILVLFSLRILPAIERIVGKHSKYLALYLEVDGNSGVSAFIDKMSQDGTVIDYLDISNPKKENEYTIVQATLKLKNSYHPTYIDEIRQLPGIKSVEVMN